MTIEVTAHEMGFPEGCCVIEGEEQEKNHSLSLCSKCTSPPMAIAYRRSGSIHAPTLGLTFDGLIVVGSWENVQPHQRSSGWGIEFLKKVGVYCLCVADDHGDTHDVWAWRSLKVSPQDGDKQEVA